MMINRLVPVLLKNTASVHSMYRNFAINALDIPIVNTNDFVNNLFECKKAVECFEKYGVMIVKDPTVDQRKNSEFID